jgi:hypothetical protein
MNHRDIRTFDWRSYRTLLYRDVTVSGTVALCPAAVPVSARKSRLTLEYQ